VAARRGRRYAILAWLALLAGVLIGAATAYLIGLVVLVGPPHGPVYEAIVIGTVAAGLLIYAGAWLRRRAG
jgi:hypothetical protein